MTSQRIAVVDDDPRIRAVIRRCLEPEGFAIDEAEDAAALDRLLERHEYALITLDLTLPDGDGVDVARTVRARSRTPIIMVTGKGDVIDRVVGLEVGADDYIAKPFHVREFLARVRTVLRRASGPAGSSSTEEGLRIGRMLLLPDRRELKDANGRDVALTTSEFEVLLALARTRGRNLTRDALMDVLHGRDWSPLDRSIDNTVARLRKKLPEGTIKTIRSVGYQIGVPVRVETVSEGAQASP